MGIINRLSKKCIFCKKREDAIYTPSYGIYGEATSGHWYHKECIRKICTNPEKHGHKKVDLALSIIECIEYWKRKDAEKIEKFNDACEKLQEKCI
jgi:hypothetical protein